MAFFGFLGGRAGPARREPPVAADRVAAGRVAVATGLRRFKAARPDRLAGFAFGPTGDDIRRDLRGLVAHAREAAQNSDFVRQWETMLARHVVGPAGIALQMAVRDESGAFDTAANERIEAAWKEWGRRGECSVCGGLSWFDIETVGITAAAREGNFLLRLHRGRGAGRFAFRVQVLSVDHLDIEFVRAFNGETYVNGGIEFDRLDRPLAYHLFESPPGSWARGSLSLRRVRVPAGEIVHVFRPREPMQALGAPWSHTALRRLNMVGQFEESALAAAHFGAAQMGFFKRPDDEGPAPAGEEEGPLEEIEAGHVATLPGGWDYVPHNPHYPDQAIGPFLKHMLRGAAVGLGVSYSGLTGDLEGANFSSLRAGLSEERDEYRMIQRWFAAALHDRVFSAWLDMALLSGAIGLPAAKFAKFNAATWRGRGWAAVNPAQEATAVEADLRNGLAAPSDVAGARGEDFEEIVQRRKRDFALLADAGDPARPGFPPAPAPAAAPAPPRPDEE